MQHVCVCTYLQFWDTFIAQSELNLTKSHLVKINFLGVHKNSQQNVPM